MGPVAVPAPLMLACPQGHLDEFPWVTFVHRGRECPNGRGSRLSVQDLAGNVGPNVIVRCECGAKRNLVQAIGRGAAARLPGCRGRHPHLGIFEECSRPTAVRTLILGASNQWFAISLSALHLPSQAHGVAAAVETSGGVTGGGKSVFLNQALTGLVLDLSPARLRLVLGDLKGGMEFGIFRDLPHLLASPATRPPFSP